MVKDRGYAAISHIMRPEHYVLPCLPQGGWKHEHIHTHASTCINTTLLAFAMVHMELISKIRFVNFPNEKDAKIYNDGCSFNQYVVF